MSRGFIFLATLVGVVFSNYAVGSVTPSSTQQGISNIPILSLTMDLSSTPHTEKLPPKVDAFTSLTLTENIIDNSPLDRVVMQICAQVNCDNITSLSFKNCNWALIDSILPRFTKLKKLAILGDQEHEPLDAERTGIIHSICTLLENSALTELSIQNAFTSDNDAQIIFDSLKEDNSLNTLNLSYNNITDASVPHINDLIRKKIPSGVLDLSGNKIKDAGALKIQEAQSRTHSNTQIRLENNLIMDEGLRSYFGLPEKSDSIVAEYSDDYSERSYSSYDEEEKEGYFSDNDSTHGDSELPCEGHY